MDLTNYKTSAQMMTAIGYNEETRNLDFQCRCNDVEDLFACIKIIGDCSVDGNYNNFNPKRVIRAFEPLVDAVKKAQEANKHHRLYYYIGREASPVIYIKNIGVPIDRYEKIVESVGKNALADECYDKFNKLSAATAFGKVSNYRLWWD